MKDKHRSLRKAAVLVASLEADRAAAIFAQMSPAQADALRQAVESLGPLDPSEQSEVIEEFFRIGPLVPDREPSGIALDDPACARFTSVEPQPTPPAPAAATPKLLHEASAETLAPFLEREHPQTVAIVVAQLPSERAAQVLAGLPAEMQVEVARRLVDLDETDPEILGEIERGVENWLAERTRQDRRRAAGLTALHNILQAANPRTREHILANLECDARPPAPPADEPERPALTFTDVARLDAASLAVVLHHAELELLALALAGASHEFAERALGLVPPQSARVLREALCHLGPTCLSDIEDAQRELAELATQLDRRQELAGKSRRLSVAV